MSAAWVDTSIEARPVAGTGGYSPGAGSPGSVCTAGVSVGPSAGVTCGWCTAGGP